MKNWTWLFLFICLNIQAESTLQNLREGNSFYMGKSEKKSLTSFYESHEKEALFAEFAEVLETPKVGVCGIRIHEELNRRFGSDYTTNKNAFLLAFRDSNQIDDVSYKIILDSSSLSFKKPIPVLKATAEKLIGKDEIIKAILNFTKKNKRGECPSDNYNAYVNAVRKHASKFNKRFLKKTHFLALKRGDIKKSEFELLEKLRQGKTYEWSQTVKTYNKKLISLRNQFPVTKEESNFVTKKSGKEKYSHREKLFKRYTQFQIALMGNIVSKMRTRLNATRIDIQIWEDDETVGEVIVLSPMERFRFILKLLRKEMEALGHNSLMNGLKPSYIDIMTSAYEVGMVPEVEVAEMASLEDIWNPQKSKWEKVVFWIRTFGSAGAVLLPPPFGFVSVLGLMALEQTTRKEPLTDRDFSLF